MHSIIDVGDRDVTGRRPIGNELLKARATCATHRSADGRTCVCARARVTVHKSPITVDRRERSAGESE